MTRLSCDALRPWREPGHHGGIRSCGANSFRPTLSRFCQVVAMRPINRSFEKTDLKVRCFRCFELRCIIALIVALAWAVPARADAPTILVDGLRLSVDAPAVANDGRVLVPLRGVFERLGAAVSYDAKWQAASASRRGVLVQVRINSRDAWVNGTHSTLDVGAREVAGRVMIPLRFVAESLGVAVDYEAANNAVVIVTGLRPGSFAASISGPTYSLASAARAPSVEDQRPSQGELIGSQYPSIYARFHGGATAVNPSSVRVVVDGMDVTDRTTISSAYFSYTPNTPMQTGQHTVSITGAADDGTPFSTSWTFRVDAGSSSLYAGGTAGGFGPAFDDGLGFRRFGFFPPGFSLFTPGQLIFFSGNVIEVIFVSRFFIVGSPIFTIGGLPGTFPLMSWPGNPGFFWGFATVPFGVHSNNAVIAARFGLPDGRTVIVHSTALMQIDGRRTSPPASLRYAVLAAIIAKPPSPRHLVAFQHVEPVGASAGLAPKPALRVGPERAGPLQRFVPVAHLTPVARAYPVMRASPWRAGRPLPAGLAPLHVLPIVRRPAPIVIRAVPIPAPPAPVVGKPLMPVIPQWQPIAPIRAPAPAAAPVKPK